MCTGMRFNDDQGQMYFGRNLDWTESYGQKVVVTPRGYKYVSAFLGELKTLQAVVGMAVVVENKPLYFDCGNEAGLAVAGLNFPGYAKYRPEPVDGMINVAPYEFPLWVAMNFKTVDEVEKALTDVVIVDKALNDQYPISKLHWLIADDVRSIVVEYTEKGMEIFNNDPDVLTNQPGYNWHRENLRNYMNLSNAEVNQVRWGKTVIKPFGAGALMQSLPGGYYSTARFIRATYLNMRYPEQTGEDANVARMFHTLSEVAMIYGAAVALDGKFERTIYTSCFAAGSKTYYYNTYEDFTIRKVSLADYDLESGELRY